MIIYGPINIIKLEGSINGIKKTIFLFMDIHIPKKNINVNKLKIRNKKVFTIDKFFEYYFKQNIDEMLDFFLEIQSYYLYHKINIKSDRHIDSLFEIFKENYNIKKSTNKIIKSKKFKNVRFHYLDLRDYLMVYDIFKIFKPILNHLKYIRKMKMKLMSTDLLEIKDSLFIIYSKLQFIYLATYSHDLYSFPKNIKLIDSNENTIPKKKVILLINKIKNIYKNKKVKLKINKILNEELKNNFEELFRGLDCLIKIIDKSIITNNKIKISVDILIDKIKEIIDSYIRIMSKITDLYFLRRILDKEYIKKSLVYTGASHSLMYIYAFVKYFNFVIKDYVYIKDESKVYSEIKKIKNFKHVLRIKDRVDDDYFNLFIKKNILQYVDTSNFIL